MPVLLSALVVLLVAAPTAAQTDGAFTIHRNERTDRTDQVNLNLQYADGRSNYGRNFDRSAFSDVNRSGDRITFALRRAAGVFTFEGRGTLDRASGWFQFAPSAEFRRELERNGFRDVDDRALFVLAIDGLTVADITKLDSLVSDDLDTAKLVRLINHGAGLRYVQAMTDAGFRNLSTDEYRRARDHGVSSAFVNEMADLGIKLPLEELVRMRDHGVTPEYVRGMRAAGHDVGAAELVRARDHGVSTEFVRRMKDLGYGGLELAEYVRMRDHGVTPEYVEALRDAGLSKVSTRELVRLRDHGISARYVRRAKELFRETPTVDQIIRLRTRGDIDR